MRILVHQVTVPLDYCDADVVDSVARTLRCRPELIRNIDVGRRSLDARPRNPEPRYVLSVSADIDPVVLPSRFKPNEIQVLDQEYVIASQPNANFAGHDRPLVVGAGPAGLLAAHVLAEAGARPILVERGDGADVRIGKVADFWQCGTLDPKSNVLFGEGGAGLFSDGKLTARTKDHRRFRKFMELLISCGAPEDILVDAAPHLGSDVLLKIVPEIRAGILANGGEVRFGARLERLILKDERVRAAVVNEEEIACSQCILAVGHSARDVYAMLAETGVSMEPKSFAVGVRLELPQPAVDRAQYGRFAGDPRLGAATFRLTRKAADGNRACYSFCMCPGGRVIACASEPGHVTTNGMSNADRALQRGNAAFLVPVRADDFPAGPVPALAGISLQRELESKAYAAGGGDYVIPAIRLNDFLKEDAASALPDGLSCPRAVPADLEGIFPDFVTRTLRASIPRMLRELNGVSVDSAVLFAAEVRSSSPVRISRNASGCSVNVQGLYPAGEGSGYAGGIVSSAIDGIKAAEACCESC